MSEGSPEYRATEGPAMAAGMSTAEAHDLEFGNLLDVIVTQARAVRGHVQLHPFRTEVSQEFLEELRALYLSVDAHERLEATIEQAAGVDELPAGETVFDESWRRGFLAGALAQHTQMVLFAQARAWVKVGSAMQLMPIVEAPAAPARERHDQSGSLLGVAAFAGQSTTNKPTGEASDVRP